jgi:hypothetical protein
MFGYHFRTKQNLNGSDDGMYTTPRITGFVDFFYRKITLWPESASELYRPSDRRLSAKLVPTFSDRGCHVVSVTDLYGRILFFLDRNLYFFFQVAHQLYSRC